METNEPTPQEQKRKELLDEMMVVMLRIFQFIEKYNAAKLEFPDLEIDFLESNLTNTN